MEILKAKGISKYYVTKGEHIHALENISLTVNRGEFVSLVGPSGCGKSTLLRILAGLEKNYEGEVYFQNIPINGPSWKIGMMFQDYALLPWKTIYHNIELGLKYRSFPPKKRRGIVESYLEISGLAGFEKKYPHELSGGMRQRASFCRTLANDPEVILMDEPLAALDAQTRVLMQSELLRIWGQEKISDERKTIVYVTHSIEEATYLSDRVALFSFRPGTIKEIVDVDLGRPRKDQTRGEQKFKDFCIYFWDQLKTELIQTI